MTRAVVDCCVVDILPSFFLYNGIKQAVSSIFFISLIMIDRTAA